MQTDHDSEYLILVELLAALMSLEIVWKYCKVVHSSLINFNRTIACNRVVPIKIDSAKLFKWFNVLLETLKKQSQVYVNGPTVAEEREIDREGRF